MNSPCYDPVTKTDCPNRCQACSITCEKWARYSESRNAEYARVANAAKANVRSGACDRATWNAQNNIRARSRGRKMYY